ncbi:MAG: prolyl oligopeptidase family serine peptidase [Candidatus Nanopelagicales bacterium]|nr:prolyl oligopeptidase family serine peptidase [Candidatus Nanopelagicales bacterium]
MPWGAGNRQDDFGWLAGDGPAVLDALRQERAYYEARVQPLAPLRDELAAEMRGLLPEAEVSVSFVGGQFVYLTQFQAGADLPCLARRPRETDDIEVLVDLGAVAAQEGSTYAEFGLTEPGPGADVLAWSVDLTGAEKYSLRFRDLTAGDDLPDRVEGTYYTGAWDASGSRFLYVVPDHAMRPWQVREHILGTPADTDRLILQEDDESFEVTVRGTRSAQWIVIEARSRDTSESWLLPAGNTTAPPRSVAGRRRGVEYSVDHAPSAQGDEILMVTNDAAEEFRVLAASTRTLGPWREVVAHDPTLRLLAIDAFAEHVVLTMRSNGLPLLRVAKRDWSACFDIEPADEASTVCLIRVDDFDPDAITIRTESRTTPATWWDVDLDSGDRAELHTAMAPGLDPTRYTASRVWVTARDGAKIPVTLTRRHDIALDGSAPCLLYGYGAYEYVFEPEFDAALPALLERGVVFAHAHVRGGGEMGRTWWEQGRLLKKRTTFDDFIDVADALAHNGSLGLVDGRHIASRGLSAGGLLQGAVYSQRPDRWCAVVAEVPFVDVVTAMSDPSIPLTVNEWDEWGDPRDPEYMTYMLGYSPYDNPPPTVGRPALLVTGALHDPRVLVREPAKWVSVLRATDPDLGAGTEPTNPTSPGTVLFRVETDEGSHMGPAGRHGHLDYEAEVAAWLLTVLA